MGDLEDETYDVVEDAKCHQTKNEVESYGVYALNPFIGKTTTSDHLSECDENVATIEHGDGEEVHERQH